MEQTVPDRGIVHPRPQTVSRKKERTEQVTSFAEGARSAVANASRFARERAQNGTGPVAVIATGAGIASFSMNFWIPFLPLYMKHLGATSDANALFWVGIATAGQGVARLISGPFWGILSDRVGRKLMFMRALYFATATTAIAAFATEPWHVAIAFACQGLFSGFIPAAVALTSVTVPDSRLNSSLGLVTGAQYLGNTVGPAVGAVLAVMFGLRGAIFAGAILPAIAATLVLFLVPRDHVAQRPRTKVPGEDTTAVTAEASFWRSLSFQFYLAIVLYFLLFGLGQLVRFATPLALVDLSGSANVETAVGIAFTIAGVASVVGIMLVGRRYIQPGRFRVMLAVAAIVTALAHVLLAFSPGVAVFVIWFSVISLLQAAMLPATNTLIASNVSRDRRGTAFGLASSAQAIAFMVGPMTAAGFAAWSMDLGFIVVGACFLVLGVFVYFKLKEPQFAEDRL
jgi:MFS transporter, DHA1 family, multidrug resistance protein